MKTKMKISVLFLLVCLSAVTLPQKTAAQGVAVSFQVFYDELSPYGTWMYTPDYGYVWVPDVAPGFTPYATNGYWIFTVEGWTWVSDYSWGWAPFHYGRWYVDPAYGHVWVPDNEWGPGWVTWRRSAGFYGWAPIGPGVSITIAYGNNYYIPGNQWTFVRNVDFGRTNINKYYISNTYNVTIINSSTVINNTRIDRSRNVTYNGGPARAEVEKSSGKRFAPVMIRESSKPGQNVNNSELHIYKPRVSKNSPTGNHPAPNRVDRDKKLKSPAQPVRTQPSQQPRKEQPARQQPPQQQHKEQPAKQQPPQQQHKEQPAKQQPPQQQHKEQPAKQQPAQQHKEQPARQQPSQPQQIQPSKKAEKEPKEVKPPKSSKE